MNLSNKVKFAISALFDECEAKEVERLLIEQCSNNVPGCSDWSKESLERVWLSVLKISNGSIEKLHGAISQANTDYRDLFMSAGFGYDAEAHKNWQP
ncbi:MAG TPA: hypothetical protein VF268_00240 [Gammaproteobacteria bacterium]|jgi:hypothetical protein